MVGANVVVPIHWGTLYVPGFRAGRWGWSSLDAGPTFARQAERLPDLRVAVLEPGEQRDLTG